MTADVELLPLPNPAHPTHAVGPLWSAEQMLAYARANVAHVTAAKDADLEALRAERDSLERSLVDAMAEVAKLDAAEARAERLAEALRPHIEDLERSAMVLDQYSAMAPTAAEMRKAAAELRAALRDHDQEGKDGRPD